MSVINEQRAGGARDRVSDADCVRFLQWALPRLGMRWPGFRKVRRQVCKRIARRIADLALPEVAAYQDYLEAHGQEWAVLDAFCRVTVSRFRRDRSVFECLGSEVLPSLARIAAAKSEPGLCCWSAGCASGEEPYSVALTWLFEVQPLFPRLALRITATDIDPGLLERAHTACYSQSSLKELPEDWRSHAFEHTAAGYRLRPPYRAPVRFERQDIREAAPEGRFRLVLCRNLAFTYFDDAGQKAVLARITERLDPGGVLVLGAHEALPAGSVEFHPWAPNLPVYRKQEE